MSTTTTTTTTTTTNTTTIFIVTIILSALAGKEICVNSSHKKQLLFFGTPLANSLCFASCDSAIKSSDVVLCVQPSGTGLPLIKHEACWR